MGQSKSKGGEQPETKLQTGGDSIRKEVRVMKDIRKSSKSELERLVLEVIKVARRLNDLKRDDPSRAGIYKTICQRLERLEKQVYKLRRKSQSKDMLDKIANEVVLLIGNLTKSLIRYLLSPYIQWSYLSRVWVYKGRSGDINNEYWINFEALASCFRP
jgi:CII-binding regulator of phage lambda lysogenization HflD